MDEATALALLEMGRKMPKLQKLAKLLPPGLHKNPGKGQSKASSAFMLANATLGFSGAGRLSVPQDAGRNEALLSWGGLIYCVINGAESYGVYRSMDRDGQRAQVDEYLTFYLMRYDWDAKEMVLL